jgi:dolichyl-phosphate-mannose-protein mannosyltransferase
MLWELRVNLDVHQGNQVLSALDDNEWWIAPLIFTALAFFTRWWKIGLSPIVTWDEAQ